MRGSTEWNRANYNILDQQPRQQHINCSSDTQQQIHQPQLGQRQHSRQQQPQSNNGTPHLERQQQPQPNNEMANPELQHKLQKNTREDLTVILGDSVTRGINARNIRSTSKNAIIRTFSGATINDMLDYIKPSLRLQPDHIIIHAGTNDLKSTEVNAIIENISKLCDEIYNFCPKIDITISQLITRTDSPDINGKVAHTNNLLHDLCEARNLGIITHENIDERGLDRFGLHLNRTGSDILARNLIVFSIFNHSRLRTIDDLNSNQPRLNISLTDNPFHLIPTKGLTFFHLNIQAITNKLDQVKLMISESIKDRKKNNIIFCFSETHLNSNWSDKELEIKEFHLIRKDRTYASGGGILIYIPKSIDFQHRNDFLTQENNCPLECIWLPTNDIVSPITLNINGISIKVGDLFNEYFSSIAENFDVSPQNNTCNALTPIVINQTKFSITLITFDDMLKLVAMLDQNKATGLDDIPAYFIKSSIHSITPIILRICNMSIEHGIFPDMWKKARLIPIHKDETLTERSNYRPISILPVLSKLRAPCC